MRSTSSNVKVGSDAYQTSHDCVRTYRPAQAGPNLCLHDRIPNTPLPRRVYSFAPDLSLSQTRLSPSNHIDILATTMTSDDILEFVRFDSIDSNATAPNLPGPGRTVGLLFDWLGTRMERVLSIRALKLGYDPDAVARDIRKLCRHHERRIDMLHKFPGMGLTSVDKKRLKKLCKKLTECARFVT